MKKTDYIDLFKLLNFYNDNLTIRELKDMIFPFVELEKQNEELELAYNLRNSDAKNYERELVRLEEGEGEGEGEGMSSSVINLDERLDETLEDEEEIEKVEDKLESNEEEIREIIDKGIKFKKLPHAERMESLGVDADLNQKITNARSKPLAFADLNRKKINKLVDNYYSRAEQAKKDEEDYGDDLEDTGYARDTPDEENIETEEVEVRCEKCKRLIDLDNQEELNYYQLFGMCMRCVKKINNGVKKK